ncbi:MAG TPA: F0F1 ATP synthase subunit alpha [Patescibacteria group bacterium]|nr:F0F1 ATP synthase subunit alpha [Patescibacteria group bacterium]
MKITDSFIKEIENQLIGSKIDLKEENVGTVDQILDGVVILSGFSDVAYGEVITFPNQVKGMVVDLREDEVGAIVFGDYTTIREGDRAKGTGAILSVPVGSACMGRVLDGFARPIDGQGSINSDKTYPVERIAPGVIYRQSVNTPLQTGIKAIDGLIPIGRGQRELIIGDRGVGKSTIAIDTILNQKDQNIVCVYAVIGQRSSKVAAVYDLLKKKGAMEYTTIIAATSSDSASLQYIAPYVACTLGEYFMDKGKDVLVIYDDLTKHAWAYRQISLILRRPSGREAYPGDIFYLHSRLLERACRLDKQMGGGSLTALPIIETQEGDVSSYIPTNVISITDGQIFLEADLFNSGVRPAINVGISVSRVGSAAQTKAMKHVAGGLKFDLAQYREIAAFSQFESELDSATRKLLDRGARMTELLKQKKNEPLTLAQQVLILWVGTQGYLDTIPTIQITHFEERFISYCTLKASNIIHEINDLKLLNPQHEEKLHALVKDFLKTYEFTSGTKKN